MGSLCTPVKDRQASGFCGLLQLPERGQTRFNFSPILWMIVRLLVVICAMGLGLVASNAHANQVTNPFFTGTTATATSWTSSAAGTGAAFNHALSAANATITAAGGSTEFYSGCVGAACLTYPFVNGTTSGAQQSVNTTVGQNYTLSFWIYVSTANNANVEIDVYWGATKVYAGNNFTATGWQKKTLTLGAATSTSNKITVMIRDDPSYSAITGIDVSPTGPIISVSKSNQIVSDPVNLTLNPKYIPGATVRYCIVISNTGVDPATSVVATDVIPAASTFVPGSIQSGTTCANSTTAGGATFSGSTLTANVGTLAASTTFAVIFLVTIK